MLNYAYITCFYTRYIMVKFLSVTAIAIALLWTLISTVAADDKSPTNSAISHMASISLSDTTYEELRTVLNDPQFQNLHVLMAGYGYVDYEQGGGHYGTAGRFQNTPVQEFRNKFWEGLYTLRKNQAFPSDEERAMYADAGVNITKSLEIALGDFELIQFAKDCWINSTCPPVAAGGITVQADFNLIYSFAQQFPGSTVRFTNEETDARFFLTRTLPRLLWQRIQQKLSRSLP